MINWLRKLAVGRLLEVHASGSSGKVALIAATRMGVSRTGTPQSRYSNGRWAMAGTQIILPSMADRADASQACLVTSRINSSAAMGASEYIGFRADLARGRSGILHGRDRFSAAHFDRLLDEGCEEMRNPAAF